MKNTLYILFLLIIVSSCGKERLNQEENQKLSPNFSPTTTPISVLDNGVKLNECFYENNYVKLVGFDPTASKYIWYKKDLTNQFQLLSNDSILLVSTDGEYKLEIEKKLAGVGDWDTTIFINLNYCPTAIDIPEAFHPNNDGQYDTWMPILSGVSEFNLKVANSDDKVVFQTSSFYASFNGEHNGNKLSSGTYYYYLSGTYRNGYLFEFSGNFNLVR